MRQESKQMMTDVLTTTRPSPGPPNPSLGGRGVLALAIIAGCLVGCETDGLRRTSVDAYYDHDYPRARDVVRKAATDRESPEIVLSNMRLGMAALADGDLDEAERSLLRAYEYLTSGGVNDEDRTVASELLFEGVRVWKGEPYEQAMSFYTIGVLYMLRGDWENARAASANALFALRDFGDSDDGDAKSMRELAEEANEADPKQNGGYYEKAYKPVESDFALGYLMVATNAVLSGRPADGDPLFDRVVELRPELAPLVQTLRTGQYDTLLVVDGGKGPTKRAGGGDNAEIKFIPDGRKQAVSTLSLAVNGRRVPTDGSQPVVDLWTLSQRPRWWSLESMRTNRRLLGNALLIAGLGAAAIGSNADSDEAVIAGLGAMAAGLALKASSRADTRHLEYLPRTVNLVPLNLGAGRHDVNVALGGGAGGSAATWHDLESGLPGKPRVYYLRMHSAGGQGMPKWSDEPLYTVRADSIRDGDRPWIFGGEDLTPPSREALARYQQSGFFQGMTFGQLTDLYRGEGFVFRRGPQGLGDTTAGVDRDNYRHITAAGIALYEPRPGTHEYERITRMWHGAYRPRSGEVRDIMNRFYDRTPVPIDAGPPADRTQAPASP